MYERTQASLEMFLLDESTDTSQQLREHIKIIDKLTAVGGTTYCRKLWCEDQISFLEGLSSSFIISFFFPFKAKNNASVCPSPVGSLIAWKPHEFPPGQPALWDGCLCLSLSWARCCSGRTSSRAGSGGAATARAENCPWPQEDHDLATLLVPSYSILCYDPRESLWTNAPLAAGAAWCAVHGAPAKSMFCCLEILGNEEYLVGRAQYKQRHENYLENWCLIKISGLAKPVESFV